jgi:glycosyltransferase involved in cell wall biosynthesis
MPRTDHVGGRSGLPAYTVTHLRDPERSFALVIPVINENGRLTGQLDRIKATAPDVDVIIADGGSTDGSTTPESLLELGVTTLLTKTGPGKLSAQLRMAIHHCLNLPYRAVITMDGNGKDGVEGIATIAAALRNGYDFVQGSRFIPGGHAINTPHDRYLAIRLIHAPITSLGAGRWYTDTTNGFRGHSRRLLEDPRVAPLREEFDTYELLAYLPIRAARLGYRITEVPVTRTYPREEATPTKIHGTSAHARMLRILASASTGGYNPR